MDVSFSAYQLIIDDQFATRDNFNSLIKYNNSELLFSKVWHIVELEKIDDNFYWIYVEYGKSLPHSPVVFNENNRQKEKNPRAEFHAELNRQLFCLYDVQDMVLYMSNSKKKNFISSFISEKLHKEVILKSIVNNIDDFLATISHITKIELVRVRNLITLDADVFNTPTDVFGLGSPIDAKLEVNYSPTRTTEKFKKFLLDTIGKKQSGEIKSFVCIGQDESHFEAIFNLENMQYKTTLACEKDTNGMIDKDYVKYMIHKKIASKNV